MKKLENMIKAMAIGDHNGYKYENMNRRLISKIKPKFLNTVIKGNPLKDSTITDDTEHMIITYLSLESSKNLEDNLFAVELENNIKKWFSTFPVGIGKATLKSCINLTLFKKKYTNSGFFSAGNGPLMRAPIIGLYYNNDEIKRKTYTKISTIITHTDPLAELASQSVADIVSFLSSNDISNNKQLFLEESLKIIKSSIDKVNTTPQSIIIWNKFYSEISSLNSQNYELYLMTHFPKGVSGFSLDTLKMAILQIYHFNELKTIIENCVYAGGDTDSTTGIVSAIYSVTQDNLNIEHEIDINSLYKIINGSYFYRILYSSMEWYNSLISLWRFIYFLKK